MSNRDTAIANALAWFDDDQGYFETLSKRVAVQTESQEPSQLPELYRYLEKFIRPDFEDIGYEVIVYDNPFEGQGPVLLARRIEDLALPTILGYGHGDAVCGQADRWTKGEGPWVLSRDGDHVYGRDHKHDHRHGLGPMAPHLWSSDQLAHILHHHAHIPKLLVRLSLRCALPAEPGLDPRTGCHRL